MPKNCTAYLDLGKIMLYLVVNSKYISQCSRYYHISIFITRSFNKMGLKKVKKVLASDNILNLVRFIYYFHTNIRLLHLFLGTFYYIYALNSLS